MDETFSQAFFGKHIWKTISIIKLSSPDVEPTCNIKVERNRVESVRRQRDVIQGFRKDSLPLMPSQLEEIPSQSVRPIDEVQMTDVL